MMVVSSAGIISSGRSTDYIKNLVFTLFLSWLCNDAAIVENIRVSIGIQLGELFCNEIGIAVTLF
jgi:hypothetical protein